MGEWKYVIKRILQMIPVLLIVTIAIFFGMRLLPGDPALLMVGNRASDEAIAAMRAKLGLDRPILIQYLLFLKQCITFDFGNSMTMNTPVAELFWQRAAVTIPLTILTGFFSVLLSFPLGYLAGVKHGSRIGSLLDSFSLFFISVPDFLTGLLLMLCFSLKLRCFPIGGWGGSFFEKLHALILPALTGAFASIALLLRNIKGNVIKVLKQDYVAFAYSKGLSNWQIKTKYIFRNIMIPAITLLTMRMTYMLAGSIVIENVFALPGLGEMLLHAILSRDYPVVQGMVFLFAVIVMFMNLITDLLYSLLDARVRLE